MFFLSTSTTDCYKMDLSPEPVWQFFYCSLDYDLPTMKKVKNYVDDNLAAYSKYII